MEATPTPRHRHPGDLEPADSGGIECAVSNTAILNHLGRYRVTTKGIISELFYDGKECGHILKRMEEEGYVEQKAKGASGGFTYVLLAGKGAAFAGVPQERSQHTQASIDRNLGISFACTLAGDRHYRLENDEVSQFLGVPGLVPSNLDFLAVDSATRCGIYRVYFAENPRSAMSGLAELMRTCSGIPGMKSAMDDGVFGVAVLCRTPGLMNRLKSTFYSEQSPLSKSCHLLVTLAPGVGELADAMKWRRQEYSSAALVAEPGSGMVNS